MELKDLSFKELSEGTCVSYYEVSRILNGKLTEASKLKRIVAFVKNHPMPKEVSA